MYKGQDPGTDKYSFRAAAATRVTDGRSGNLKLYLVLSSTTKTLAELTGTVLTPANVSAMPTEAKNEAFSAADQLAAPVLFSSHFWNGSAWVFPGSLESPFSSSPQTIHAYLVAFDPAGNVQMASDLNIVPYTTLTLPTNTDA